MVIDRESLKLSRWITGPVLILLFLWSVIMGSKGSVSGSSSEVISDLDRPFCVSTNVRGEIFVCEFDRQLIFKFEAGYSGRQIFIDDPILSGPHSVDFLKDGSLLVNNYFGRNVSIFGSDGTLRRVVAESDLLAGPATAYLDRSEKILVADYDANLIHKIDLDGSYLGSIGHNCDDGPCGGWKINPYPKGATDSPGQFDRPHAAIVDSEGAIYVADTWNHRVQKFSSEGVYLGWLGSSSDGFANLGWRLGGKAVKSSEIGGFDAPVALAIDQSDILYVLEYGGNRVQAIEPSGEVAALVAKNLSNAYDITVSGDHVFVADTGNKSIKRYDIFVRESVK